MSLNVDFEYIIKECGFSPKKMLGCGNYGCVFLTPKKTAIKLTTNYPEFVTAERLFSLQERGDSHPGIPNIYNIALLGRCNESGLDIYMIERDEVKDIKWVNLSGAEEAHLDLEDEKSEALKFSSLEELAKDDFFVETISILADNYKLGKKDKKILTSLAEVEQWAFLRGFEWHDIVLENIGQKRGKAVIRDLGYFIVKDLYL